MVTLTKEKASVNLIALSERDGRNKTDYIIVSSVPKNAGDKKDAFYIQCLLSNTIPQSGLYGCVWFLCGIFVMTPSNL